jgi:hypothetical protein
MTTPYYTRGDLQLTAADIRNTLGFRPSGWDLLGWRYSNAGTVERWHGPARTGYNINGAGQVFLTNTIYAVPFITPRGCNIDMIGIWVVTNANSCGIDMGIYENTSLNTLYPSTSLFSSSIVNPGAAAPAKLTISPSLARSENTICWLAFEVTGACTGPVVAYFPDNTIYPLLGVNSNLGGTGNEATFLTTNYVNGGAGLPTNYPAIANSTWAVGNFPALFVRLSSLSGSP